MGNSADINKLIAVAILIVLIFLYVKIVSTVLYRCIVKPIFKFWANVPFLLHLVFFFLFAGIPYFFIFSYMAGKEQDSVFNDAIHNPNDKTVNNLLNYCNKVAMRNHPDTWSQLRGMWNVINHSPNVSSDLKRKILAMFMSKGLYINNTNIIDNCKK